MVIIGVLRIFESFCFFTSSMALPLFLEEEFKFDKFSSIFLFSFYGILTTLLGVFFSGHMTNRFGIKKSMLLGFALIATSRLWLAGSYGQGAVFLNMWTLMPLGTSLAWPSIIIGIRRYTIPVNRTFMFAVFNILSNVGGLFLAPFISQIKLVLEEMQVIIGHKNVHVHSSRLLFVFLGVITVFMTFIVVGLEDYDLENDRKPFEKHREVVNPFDTIRKIVKNGIFYKMLLTSFIIMMTGVVFNQLTYTIPDYMNRLMGDDPYVGFIEGSYHIMLVVFAIIFAPISIYFNEFW